jgi:hypothetical protein
MNSLVEGDLSFARTLVASLRFPDREGVRCG